MGFYDRGQIKTKKRLPSSVSEVAGFFLYIRERLEIPEKINKVTQSGVLKEAGYKVMRWEKGRPSLVRKRKLIGIGGGWEGISYPTSTQRRKGRDQKKA